MRTASLSLYLMGAILGVVILLAAYVVYENHERDESLLEARIERVTQINRINFDLCQQIQELYAVRRREARESYKNLAQNARLLGIKVTPELRREALRGRDRTLERFKARTCPKEILTIEEE